MCTNEFHSNPLVANLMERDHNKNSPSNERGGGNDGAVDNTPLETLTDSLENVVVSSSFPSTVSIAPPSPQETPKRKRVRVEEQGGGSSSGDGQKGKKKGELTNQPSTEPKCATCGKAFGSWKAVFGHLRSHPEREYRGAFPPPKMWEEMLQQHGQDQAASSSTAVVGGLVGSDVEGGVAMLSGRGIGIDLNDPEGSHKEEFPFDLNMPAPESEEEEDDNNES